jgi:hypothetical protein
MIPRLVSPSVQSGDSEYTPGRTMIRGCPTGGSESVIGEPPGPLGLYSK